MTTPEEVKRARAARRRHKHERQAVVFGVLIAFMAVSGLAAAAIYTGAIDPPFNRDFTAKESSDDAPVPQPCLPADTLPVPYASITLRVLNSTDRAGLASAAADDLVKRGFVVESTGNSKKSYSGVQVAFGSAGLASAYTLAAHIPEARFIYDDREDATLDLYLGDSFAGIADIDAVSLDPTVAMASLEGCTVIEALDPTPRATTAAPVAPTESTPEDAPVGDVPAEDVPAG